MVLVSLIALPLLIGLLTFFVQGRAAWSLAMLGSAALAGLGVYTATAAMSDPLSFSTPWLPQLGASCSLLADGLAGMLCALTGIVMMVVILAQQNKPVEREGSFYGLMLLSAAGLMGVFLAADCLLFYFFWELALIPVYFLCSRWGGERRIPVTFKFFVYTFLGSLFLLAGVIYVWLQTPGEHHSYAWADMVRAGAALPAGEQTWVFLLFFAAFAIKMPIFPFHTWQPDTYEQSPTPVTIILSALMVKMGIYAVLRWLMPVLPAGTAYWSNWVMILSVAGIVYASCIAMVQTDVKRLVAYSSIAHMGLMSAAIFGMPWDGITMNTAVHAAAVQMFNHGINICGMWLIVSMIESRYGTRDMTKLGGMAGAAPWLSIALVVISFANIALPLTNGFIGEFMLFNGLFQSANPYHVVFMVVAGLSVILGAVYTLTMVQRVAYGAPRPPEGGVGPAGEATITQDLTINEWLGLAVIIGLIIFLGIYPAPLLSLVG